MPIGWQKKLGKNKNKYYRAFKWRKNCDEFRNKNPDKIRRLILIDSAGIYHNDITITLKRTVFKIIAKAGKRILDNPSAKKLLYKVIREDDYERADKTMKKQ